MSIVHLNVVYNTWAFMSDRLNILSDSCVEVPVV